MVLLLFHLDLDRQSAVLRLIQKHSTKPIKYNMAKSKSKSDKRSKPTTKVQDSKESDDKRTATKKEMAKEIKKSENKLKKNVAKKNSLDYVRDRT